LLFIRHLTIERFRAIGNRIELSPGMVNILVGRNNTGKSSILDAVALIVSSLNDYRDMLGRPIFKEVFSSEKNLRLKYLMHNPSKEKKAIIEAVMSVPEWMTDERLSLEIAMYGSELPNKLRQYLMEHIEERMQDFDEDVWELEKYLLSTISSLEPERIKTSNFIVVMEDILAEVRDLKERLQSGADLRKAITKLDDIKEHINDVIRDLKSETREVIYRNVRNLRLRIEEKLRERLMRRKKLFFILKKNYSDIDVRFLFTEPLTISASREEITRIFRQIVFDTKLYPVFPPFGLRIKYDPYEPVKLYVNPRYQELKGFVQGLYATHRGAWRFKDLNLLFSKVFDRGRKNAVLSLLREAMINMRDIGIVKEKNREPVLKVLTDVESVPVYVFGDGFIALLRLTLLHSLLDRGILLLEEPETSMHPGYIALYASVLLEAARKGVQVFLTTHSLDLIKYVVQLGEDLGMMDHIKVIRMYRYHEGVVAVEEMTCSDALGRMRELEEDLRGI